MSGPSQPERAAQTGDTGFVLPATAWLFLAFKWLSPLQWLRQYWTAQASGRGVGQNRTDLPEWCVDMYLVVWPIVTAGIFLAAMAVDSGARSSLTEWGRWLIIAFLAWRSLEIFQASWNIAVFDDYREAKPPADIRRNLVFGAMNYVESVLIFALLIRLRTGDYSWPEGGFDSMWQALHASLKVATFVGLPESRGTYGHAMIVAQVALTLSILLVLLAWVIAQLPSRKASNAGADRDEETMST